MNNTMNNKMWAILVHLSMDMWVGKDGKPKTKQPLKFDEDIWDYILEESVKCGINTIVLDVGNGIEFASHPEIVKEGAWTRARVRKEVARCRELGIALIPKLNFSASHDMWLGVYARMLSTPEYYKVCNDLIREVYELFDKPEYIHLGMDEEDAKHQKKYEYCVFRQGEQYFKDLRYLIDCVHDVGAMPWIWACPLFDFTEDFKKYIDPKEVVLSPWYYNAFRKEHYTPISSRAEYVAYYNEGDYAKMGIEYVEEDPFLVNVREKAIPLMKDGYMYVPCASVWNRCDWNHSDLVEYFRDNAPDSQIVGYITAPWCSTTHEEKRCMPFYEESFRFFKEAKEKFYG
ncbi:MAG: hypothetical protein IJ454_04160 [Clostridia bacterium]|nr:hypothetical protein [Clostridia bacterium]